MTAEQIDLRSDLHALPTDEMWDAIIDVHLTAPFKIIRAAVPHMREVAKQEIAEGKRVQRKIINVSSTSGVAGNPGQANYSAGKMGVVGLTKTMAKEWGRFNINVNAVAYGFIETRLTAAKEKQQPVQVGENEILKGVLGMKGAEIEKLTAAGVV